MPDQVTKVTKIGWGSRIGSSLKGILVGLLLFLISFGVLYWNEGRVDMSEFSADAVQISSEQVDADNNGNFIHTTGEFKSQETLGDDYLKPGNYIALKRQVEVYAWVENTESTTETKLGGSEETTTTYTYAKEWVSEPTLSGFEEPEGHENVAKTIEDLNKRVKTAKIGVYDVADMESVSLPSLSTLALTEENVNITYDFELVNNQYLYDGFYDMANPEIGDMRISYKVLKPSNNATIYGRLDGDSITSYSNEEASMYRIFYGSADEAMAQMATEHKTSTWIFRIIGFLMMWIGLSMVVAPISVLLDVLPFLGKISRSLVSIVTFIIALVLSGVTILISMFLHSLIAVIVLVVALVVIGFMYYKKIKDKKSQITKSDQSEK